MLLTTMLMGAAAVQANPAPKALPNMGVFVRGDDYSYAHSEEMAHEIRSNVSSSGLDKRSNAFVQMCTTPSCTGCTTLENGNFNSFTCFEATNTACIIVGNLDDAQVNYWNHAGCNHHESTYHGCGQPQTNVAAAGTNSIGVQIGC